MLLHIIAISLRAAEMFMPLAGTLPPACRLSLV